MEGDTRIGWSGEFGSYSGLRLWALEWMVTFEAVGWMDGWMVDEDWSFEFGSEVAWLTYQGPWACPWLPS